MSIIEKEILSSFNKHRNFNKFLSGVPFSHKFLCNAPFSSIQICIDGTISPCCYNTRSDRSMMDCYPEKSLSQIWDGEIFSSYRKYIRQNELPIACEICEKAIRNGEYDSVKINQYDCLKVSRFWKNKPRLIEMTLSNNCNLECIMCNGTLSSSIRTNREKRPPNKSIFGQEFREELSKFIPDLQEMVFAGGEPFLNPLYYDIWEDAIRLNPKCYLSVVTNGTILNDKIKSLLERGNFKINLSFDAMTKETYESIRVNAKFEETMANMKYFGDTLARQGKHLHIPICPLRANRFELPDLVRFCNDNKYSLNFGNVYGAEDVALYSMPITELREIKDFYSRQTFKKTSWSSKWNIMEFRELTKRIDQWIIAKEKEKEEKENFLDNIDLGKDKIEEYKNILLKKSIVGLNAIGYNEKEANALAKAAMDKFEKTLSSMPDYFNSNHLYRYLAATPQYQLAEYVIGKGEIKVDESIIQMLFFNNKKIYVPKRSQYNQ